MRYLTGSLIAVLACLAPANAPAQTARDSQAIQAVPAMPSAPSSNGAQAGTSAPYNLSFPKAVTYPQIGARMIVCLNNNHAVSGNLAEVHRDYFVLTDKGIAQKIMQADVVSMSTDEPKPKKTRWRRVEPLMRPFKGIAIAAALPAMGAWLFTYELIRELLGKSR